MDDDIIGCMKSCNSTDSSGAIVGNESFDLECITQCTQRRTTIYYDTAEK